MSLIDVRPIWGLGQPRSGGPRLAGGGPHSVYDKEAPHLSKEAREEREGCPMAPKATRDIFGQFNKGTVGQT